MSKLYRSLLWSGVVAAGVAACGDDVTVTPPAPPPAATVHSISVAPSGVTISVGSTLQMSAAVNADAGVATTVTWSLPAGTPTTVATISASGLLTAVGAGSVSPTACSTAVVTVCGNATITISSQASGVTQVNVTPSPQGFLSRPATGSATLQLSAAVIGTNNPSQTVTWSIPGTAPTGATVSASGLVTITSATPGGSFNVSACSTVIGFTNVCGFTAVVVQIPSPSTVSVASVTWVPAAGAPANCTPTGAASVPVVLTNVSCQIEVTANVNAGDQQLTRIDVLIGGQVVASQTFPGTAPASGGDASVSAPVSVTLSINTRQVKSGTTALAGSQCNGFACIPVITNGNKQISLNLYTTTSSTPLASDAVPIVMNNADAVVYPKTLVNTTNTPAGGFTTGGVTFFSGTQTFAGGQYIAFSGQVPTTSVFTGSLCGASSSNTITGTATSGIVLGGIFTCAGVEGSNTISAAVPAFTYAAAVGPDGTPITAPTFFSTVGSGFTVPVNAAGATELRWNLLLQNGAPVPLPVLLATVGVDNKAPTVTVQGSGICSAANGGKVAFNDLFDQCWVNAAYAFAGDISASDAGSGLAAGMPQAHDYLPGVFVPATAGCSAVVKVTGADYAETVVSDGSPDGWRICAFATDNVGNSASTGPSNWFGVDKVAPSSRLAGSTAATPLIAPLTVASVSSIANTTIYGDGPGPLTGTAPVMPASDAWGLEGLDTRSGFNQNAVAGFPASQTLSRLAPTGPTSCGAFTSPMSVVLSDTWVRTAVLVNPIDCGFGIGYYAYTGNVVDRAGNAATPILRNFARDHLAAPALASIGASIPLYTAGNSAAFFVFGSDDLEIIEGDLTMSYPNLGLITPTIEGITYPLAQINGTNPGVRWDNLLNNIVTAGTISVPSLLGRVDFTCTGAATPYASCTGADSVAHTSGNYDTVNLTDDGQSPDSVRAIAYDVASNASNPVASGLLSIQTTDVAEQWAAADIRAWQVLSVGASIVARHMASTSITEPYFSTVFLARADAGATEIRICGTFPAPTLTDNGFNRFWTYTILAPTGTAQCATGGSWYAIGIKNAAALVTRANP